MPTKPKQPLVTKQDARTKVAVRCARSLGRFRWTKDWKRTVWDRRGQWVTNPLLQVPKGVDEALEKAMDKISHEYDDVLLDVDPSLFWSFQRSLVLSRLLRYVRNYRDVSRRPRNCHYPVVVLVRGRYVIWNGNHRINAALLRGEKVPRVNVVNLEKQLRIERLAARKAARAA